MILPRYNVIGENLRQLLLVLGFHEIVESAFREFRKGGVVRRKDRKGSFVLFAASAFSQRL